MLKIMQNLVILMEPSDDADRVSLKAGNMYLNRFCIDEEAALELSQVHYLKKSSFDIQYKNGIKYFFQRKSKGKEYSSRLQ